MCSAAVRRELSISCTGSKVLYREQGLLGESNAEGQLITAYGFNPNAALQGLWSTDPIWQANLTTSPVPSLGANTTNYHYLHTDHLGTPILATVKEGNSSWKAVTEAFGAADTLVGYSEITMNLRFPGQYFDEEMHSHYNFFRNYDSWQGRYYEGDPVGLFWGVNFYSYVEAMPLAMIDPEGLMGTTVDAYCRQRPRECVIPPPSIPVPVAPPKEGCEKCEKCTDFPYSRDVPCDNFYKYTHNSYSSAYGELKMINGGINLAEGKDKLSDSGLCSIEKDYVVGHHIVFTAPRVGRAGSLVSCECCEQRIDGVFIKENGL